MKPEAQSGVWTCLARSSPSLATLPESEEGNTGSEHYRVTMCDMGIHHSAALEAIVARSVVCSDSFQEATEAPGPRSYEQ